MIEIIKSFLNKCDGNKELTSFAECLTYCWTHGTNTIYANINDDKNILIIENFFKAIYNYGNENFYSIKKMETSGDWKEYEIKWRSELVNSLMSEKNDDN